MYENCVHQQPNAADCFICGRENEHGLKMVFFDDGESTVISRVTPNQMFQGYPGVVHGGILAAILDEVVGRVVMAKDHHRFMMTVNLTVKYRLPVTVGEELLAVGEAQRIKSKIGHATGKILLADGSVACEASLTLAQMPKEIATEDRVSRLNWKVCV